MLEDRAKRLGVDGSLIFHNRFVTQAELSEFLAAADICITPYLQPEQITSVLSVTGQMINILTEQNVNRSLKELTARDVLIVPELGDFSSADFDNLIKTVPIGEAAARKVADRLRALLNGSRDDREVQLTLAQVFERGKRFGDAQNPLLVSCRSGAKFSMPGMMDTVLNIGMNDAVAERMAELAAVAIAGTAPVAGTLSVPATGAGTASNDVTFTFSGTVGG